MGKAACILLVALVASACSNPWADERPSQAEMIRTGWNQPTPLALAPRHCYRTLARVDCYSVPQPDEAGRRVGYFDAPIE